MQKNSHLVRFLALFSLLFFIAFGSAHATELVSVIDPHDTVVAEATSGSGAVVTYTPPLVDGATPADCLPVSGSTFALGDTTVTCSASGALDTTFLVQVVDTTLPIVGPHGDKSVVATGHLTPVNYQPPNAFDPKDFRIDSTRPADCTPENNSLFPLGTTAITCTAVDSSGNVALPTTFNVIVTLPETLSEGFCDAGTHFDTEVGDCVADAPVVVDICVNLEGVQTEVPAGTVQEGENCVAVPVVTASRRSGGGGGNSSVRGEVLGATTDSGTSGSSCHLFSIDLMLGSSGDEVQALQNFLMGKGYSITAGATGYFGLQTKGAVASYQTANGVTPASGYFGMLTRAKANESCAIGEDHTPTLSELLALLASLQAKIAAL